MKVNGIDLTPFTKRQRLIIAEIALRSPGRASMEDIAARIWPARQPDWPENGISKTMMEIREAWASRDWYIHGHRGEPGGYTLERRRPRR